MTVFSSAGNGRYLYLEES